MIRHAASKRVVRTGLCQLKWKEVTTGPSLAATCSTSSSSITGLRRGCWWSPATIIPCLDQSHRYLSTNNKRNHKQNHKKQLKGAASSPTREFQVYPLYDVDFTDINDIAECAGWEAVSIPKSADLNSFKKGMARDWDEVEGSMIFNSSTNELEVLESVEQVQREQSKQGRVYVADGLMFQHGDDYDKDDGYDSYGDGNNTELDDMGGGYDVDTDDIDGMEEDALGTTDRGQHDVRLELLIYRIAEQLKETGWDRCEEQKGMMTTISTTDLSPEKPTKVTKSTQALILETASEEEESDIRDFLQSLLLNQVGVLDHIAQCIHYDFVWQRKKEETSRVDFR